MENNLSMLTYSKFIIIFRLTSIHFNFVSILILYVINVNRLNHITEAPWGPQSLWSCEKTLRPNHLRIAVQGKTPASWGPDMSPAPSSVHLFPLQSLRDPARLIWLSSHPFYRCRSWGTEYLNTWHKLCRTEVALLAVPASGEVPDPSPCSPGREEGRRPRESLLTQAESVSSHYRQMYHAFFRVAWGLANCKRTSSPCLFSGGPGRLRFARWQRGTWEIKCFSLKTAFPGQAHPALAAKKFLLSQQPMRCRLSRALGFFFGGFFGLFVFSQVLII